MQMTFQPRRRKNEYIRLPLCVASTSETSENEPGGNTASVFLHTIVSLLYGIDSDNFFYRGIFESNYLKGITHRCQHAPSTALREQCILCAT